MASQPTASGAWWEQDYGLPAYDPGNPKAIFDQVSSQDLANMSDFERAMFSKRFLDNLDYRSDESSANQWLAWQKHFDPSCPPNAPYRAEDGSGCVEKPDNSNAGYQAAAGGGGGGNGGGGGGGGRGGWGNGTAGELPKFEYTPFVAPGYEDIQNDPGYQFRLKTGIDAIQKSKAAQGLVRSGGSLQDIMDYGQDLGSQEYGNMYNRALQTWGAQYQGEKDAFAPQYGGWQTMYGGDLSRWTTNQNTALQKYLQREGNIYGTLNMGIPGGY